VCHFCGPELLDPVLRCNSGRSRSNVLLPCRRTPTEKATARCQLVCNATRHLGKPPVEQIVREVRDHWRDRYYLTAPYPSCCFNFLFSPLQIAGLAPPIFLALSPFPLLLSGCLLPTLDFGPVVESVAAGNTSPPLSLATLLLSLSPSRPLLHTQYTFSVQS